MSDQPQFDSLVKMVRSLQGDCWKTTAEYGAHRKPIPNREYELFGDFFAKLGQYDELEDDAAKPAARKQILDFWSSNGDNLKNRWPVLEHAAEGFRQEIYAEDSASEKSTTASSKQVVSNLVLHFTLYRLIEQVAISYSLLEPLETVPRPTKEVWSPLLRLVLKLDEIGF